MFMNFVCTKMSNTDGSVIPFAGTDVTKILKSITHEMTGVGITVTDLRSAAESHVDTMQSSEHIQKALAYAEGHSEQIAKLFYKRNGSSTMMKEWTRYIDDLLGFDGREADNSSCAASQKILSNISLSQRRWVKQVQNELFKAKGPLSTSKAVQSCRKRRVEWSASEDVELKKRVRLHGDGNWKVILDSSVILKERYSMVSGKSNNISLQTHIIAHPLPIDVMLQS